MRLRSHLHRLDKKLFAAVAEAHLPGLERVLPQLSRAADNALLWTGAAGVFALSGRRRMRRAATRGMLAISLASPLVNLVGKQVFKRERPAARPPVARVLRMPLSASFPSGHSASAAAFATAVALEAPPRVAVPVALLASAVCFSRVYTGVHYPGDVLAGAAIGVVTGLLTRRVWPEAGEAGRARAAAAAPAEAHDPEGEGLVLVAEPGADLAEIRAALPRASIVAAPPADARTVESDVAETGAGEFEAPETEIAESGALEPEVARSEAAETEAAAIGVLESGVAESGTAEAAAAEAGAAETGAGVTGGARSFRDAVRRVAAGAKVLGVAGGDAAVADAAREALGRGLPLLAVPCRPAFFSALPAALGLEDPGDAVHAYRTGAVVAVDVGEVAGHVFLNHAGAGLHGELAARVEARRHVLGTWPALLWSLAELMRAGARPAELVVDGVPYRTWALFVGNCRYDGSSPVPRRRHRLEDGLLDVRMLTAADRLPRLRAFTSLIGARLGLSRLYRRWQADHLTLSAHAPSGRVRLTLDGGRTVAVRGTAVFAKRPRALHVLR
ncbi:bifunctional phosphatase PAP2/diacylglycerol kinase family protein [Thermoactinospora rubra]|uniref:bifunctional phosphatase PAP2/diacylglycerol kinase family protein n=1 Tax=Thermoactinospora rubra TaxID=1088767 RepID=UPI000A116E64|nr:phosphatase PAP2 family protein [Thermoactinospora rubra]